jgi:hypothetical protein
MSRKLNYGDFSRTGYQDCANVFDTNNHNDAWHRLGKPRGTGVAIKVVREAWGNDEDQYEQWLSQADVDEILKDGLELRSAYRAWRDAWQGCAESAVKADLKEWIAQEDEEDR